MTVSIRQQIEEVELELTYRREVYPRLVSAKKKRKSTAELQMTRLDAVHRTLLWLEENDNPLKSQRIEIQRLRSEVKALQQALSKTKGPA